MFNLVLLRNRRFGKEAKQGICFTSDKRGQHGNKTRIVGATLEGRK